MAASRATKVLNDGESDTHTGKILNDDEQDALIDSIVREAAGYYRAIMAGFGGLCGAILLLVVVSHFVVATGNAETIAHAEFLLSYTDASTSLLLTYAAVVACMACIVHHAASTFSQLASVRRMGTVSQAPWGSIIMDKPPAVKTLPPYIPHAVASFVPPHAVWVAVAAVAYLPVSAYWTVLLLQHELWAIHVWWLAVGVPFIAIAYIAGVCSGDSMLRDAVGLSAFKYSSKSA